MAFFIPVFAVTCKPLLMGGHCTALAPGWMCPPPWDVDGDEPCGAAVWAVLGGSLRRAALGRQGVAVLPAFRKHLLLKWFNFASFKGICDVR